MEEVDQPLKIDHKKSYRESKESEEEGSNRRYAPAGSRAEHSQGHSAVEATVLTYILHGGQ
jgi:hypothetical protein